MTRTTLNVHLGSREYQRIKRYCKRHLIPCSRIVRNIMGLIPWDDDGATLVVLSISKAVLGNPDKLAACLDEAIAELKTRLAG